MILPGSYLGVFGGGQLGWMFCMAAHAMGYRVAVFDPDQHSPAGAIADKHIRAGFDDVAALDEFAALCDAVTLEFENVPVAALGQIAGRTVLSPAADVLSVTQDRVEEKNCVNAAGLETVRYEAVHDEDDIARAFETLSPPLILKTSRFGYDGKGQKEVVSQQDALLAFDELGRCACILEQKASLKQEISVIVARGEDGDSVCYPVSENEHRNGILHTSLVPARCAATHAESAQQQASLLADVLNYQGVMGVEFFITDDDRLLVNEIAPRPHNSGHYTMDACRASQFQQQVRAMCGLPLGETTLLSPVVMVNLLGDLWQYAERIYPRQDSCLLAPDVRLYLYGKNEARPGRKMGHFCVLGENTGALAERASQIHEQLLRVEAEQ